MKNLGKSLLTDPDRKYMIQTVATVLMTYVQRPSLDCCNAVAKSLIDTYPFLKDSVGEGQVRVCMHILSVMYDSKLCNYVVYVTIFNRVYFRVLLKQAYLQICRQV